MSNDRFFPTLPPSVPATVVDDLSEIQAWANTLDAFFSSNDAVSRFAPWLFRPHMQAHDAMMRLSVKYPAIVKQVDNFLDHVENQYTEFTDDRFDIGAASATGLANAMFDLAGRIRVAVETIAAADKPNSGGQEWTADKAADKKKKSLPTNPDVLKLANKINRELPDGGTKEQIALDFANGNKKKAARLLRQLQPSRYGHLLD